MPKRTAFVAAQDPCPDAEDALLCSALFRESNPSSRASLTSRHESDPDAGNRLRTAPGKPEETDPSPHRLATNLRDAFASSKRARFTAVPKRAGMSATDVNGAVAPRARVEGATLSQKNFARVLQFGRTFGAYTEETARPVGQSGARDFGCALWKRL